MIFPLPYIKVEGGCVAILRKGIAVKINGYPVVSFNWRKWSSHRLSYHLNRKKIPRSPCKGRANFIYKMVLHTCDHKWCINPEHLYLGRHKENGKDFSDRFPEWLRKRHSENSTRIQASPAFRKKMSKATRGIPKSADWKMKAREAAYNRAPPTEETRLKMAISARKRVMKLSKRKRIAMMATVREGRGYG